MHLPAVSASPAIILTLNGGSSSIRFAAFRVGSTLERVLDGKIDRIGLDGTTLKLAAGVGHGKERIPLDFSDPKSAAGFLVEWLRSREECRSISAVGHRIVHGMRHTRPQRITRELLDDLHRIEPHDPEHLPVELELIESFQRHDSGVPQVACFDTAFHADMPRVARLLPIPRRYEALGVRRYGFHGLSYESLMKELERSAGARLANGRLILAHLGGGASMAAVRDGKSIDTSMGFTPTAGLPMSTRSGDLDPGLAWFLEQTEGMTPRQFSAMANRESGLRGISETSSDMRDLLAREATDVRAAEAVAIFCYEARKRIGAYAAALEGLDALVFSGGIGENAPVVRERVCTGLGFLGIEIDAARNTANAELISSDASAISVRVIRSDEELTIASSVARVLALHS